MLWIAQDRLRCTGFHYLTAMHDDQLLGALACQREIVGDQQHRRAQFRGQLAADDRAPAVAR